MAREEGGVLTVCPFYVSATYRSILCRTIFDYGDDDEVDMCEAYSFRHPEAKNLYQCKYCYQEDGHRECPRAKALYAEWERIEERRYQTVTAILREKAKQSREENDCHNPQ